MVWTTVFALALVIADPLRWPLKQSHADNNSVGSPNGKKRLIRREKKALLR
jgi:hypothetical protein